MSEYKPHPAAAFWPMLDDQDLRKLADDIAERGLQVPILLLDGQILDGRNRLAACELAGVVPRFTQYLGDDPFGQVLSLNEARRHLPSGQRTAIVSLIIKARGDWEATRDARANAARSATAKARPRVPQDDGSTRFSPSPVSFDTGLGDFTEFGSRVHLAAAAQSSTAVAGRVMALPTPLVVEVARGALSVGEAQAVKALAPTARAELDEAVASGVTIKAALKAHVAHNSGNNEWYTPAEYIAAAREVMGGIDLDPASSEAANETVGATVFYTSYDSGLDHEWAGRVWMNPPYAAGLIDRFCEKLASSEGVTSAIVLVNNATETRWTADIVSVATAVCFPRARVRFIGPDGAKGAPLQGQAIYYVGADVDAFCDVFYRFGWCASIRS